MDASMWDHIPEGITSEAAKPKRPTADAPTQQPMRAEIKPAQQRKPSADQKRVRRQMARQASGGQFDPDFSDEYWSGKPSGWYVIDDNASHVSGPFDSEGDADAGDGERVVHKTSSNTTASTTRTATKESTMNQPTEAHLIQRLASASTLVEQAAISAQIDAVRAARRESLATEGALDWDSMGALPPTREQQAAQRFSSMPAAGGGTRTQTTASSDWLDDLTPSHTTDSVLSATARAEATQWFANLWAPVKQDSHELSVQADNASVRCSHQFGLQASAAKSVFLDQVKHLASREGITLTALETTVDTYVSDGKTTQPVGVSPTDADKSLDEWGIGSDLNGTDPKSTTTTGDAPSLAEGDTPEQATGESLDNPNYGETDVDKSTFDVGNTDDKMSTQGGRRMASADYDKGFAKGKSDHASGNTLTGWDDGDSEEYKQGWSDGYEEAASGKTGSKTAARDCSWTRVSEPGEDDGLTWWECSTHDKTEIGGEEDEPSFPCEGWLDENSAENPYTGSRNRSKTALTNGDKATCHCGKPIEMFDYSWYHLSADGPVDWATHGPETYPGKQASKTASGDCGHCAGTGTVSNGAPGMDLGPGFPEFLDCPFCDGTGTAKNSRDRKRKPYTMASTADARISQHMASQFGGFGMGIQRIADDSTSADGLSSATAPTDAPSLAEGDTPEQAHAESPVQENGEGAVDMSHATPHDNLHDVNWGTTATQHTADGPTNSWTCECGSTVERWRGESDVSCPNCNAQYNAGGQRLRDDWRGNASNWDSEVSDMDGYENQYAHDAAKHSLAAIGASFEGKQVSKNTAVFAKALTAAKSIDDSVGGVSIRRVATMLAASPEVPHSVRQALMEHIAPMASAKQADARPLYEIAADIKRNWPNVYFGAVPYLDALGQLSTMNDRYYEDDAATIVHYLLSNMGSKFRGPEAERLKAELKALVARKATISDSSGLKCETCGDKIAQDDDGSYHHDNGEKHDHEAKADESWEDSGKAAARRTAGEVPEAFKQNWDKGDGDDADAKDESDEGKPWEKSGSRHPFGREAGAKTAATYDEGFANGKRDRESGNDPQGVGMTDGPQTEYEKGYWAGYGQKASSNKQAASQHLADGGDDYAAAKAKGKARAKRGLPSELGQDNQEAYAEGYSEGMRESRGKKSASPMASFAARVQAGISRVADVSPYTGHDFACLTYETLDAGDCTCMGEKISDETSTAFMASRKTAQDVPAGYEGGTCRTCGRDIIGKGGKWIHDPRSAGSPHPDGSVAGDAHGIVPKEGSRKQASEYRISRSCMKGGDGSNCDGSNCDCPCHEASDIGETTEQVAAWHKKMYEEYVAYDPQYRKNDTNPFGGYDAIITEGSRKQANPAYMSHEGGGGEWIAEVTGTGESTWSRNGMSYDTPEEAKAWIADLSMRWFGFDAGRVVPASTPRGQTFDPADPQITHNFR